VGASFDKPAKNAQFKASEKFAFALWSDAGRELALAWGAAKTGNQLFADRVTVVLDPQGARILHYNVGFNIAAHPQQVLSDCKALLGQ
jgi:peroxiredoxin